MLAEEIDDPIRSKDEETAKLYRQFRRDIWDHGEYEKDKDAVGKLILESETELEAAARPIINHEFKAPSPKVREV
jgi:hypothetical protein